MQDEQLKTWTLGYGLDGGGYEFEYWTDESLKKVAVEAGLTEHQANCMLMWDSPDLDYCPGWVDLPCGKYGHRWIPDLLLIYPNAGHMPAPDWPEEFKVSDHGDVTVFKLASHGQLNGSDHDCLACDGTGEITVCEIAPEVKTKCDRCDGDGYVDSPSGQYAIYSCFAEEEDDD